VQFKDRNVLLTGAAGGIGRALCPRLGRDGARLGLVDRNAAALDDLREQLKQAGVHAASAVADVRDRAAVQSAVAALSSELGPVDVLIAGAGLCGFSIVDDLKVSQLEEIIQVNFLGVVYSIEAVLPAMLERHSGQIVGIASLAAVRALPFESAYCASKAALATYLESLRPALRRRGVKVTTVFPGFIRTPLLENLLASSGAPAPPGVIEPDRAADIIVDAIRRERRVSCFPWSTSWLAHASRLLPARTYDRIMTRLAARVPLPY
jgi:short-subunit dehydrogenase